MKRKQAYVDPHVELLYLQSWDSPYTKELKLFLRTVGLLRLEKIDPANQMTQKIIDSLHQWEEGLLDVLQKLPVKEHPESDLVLHRPGTEEEAQEVIDLLKQEYKNVIPELLLASVRKPIMKLSIQEQQILKNAIDQSACKVCDAPINENEADLGGICNSCEDKGYWIDPIGTIHSPGSDPLKAYE